MNVNEICKRGMFDKVTLNIISEPIYGKDIEIYGGMTFDDCVSNLYNSLDTSVFKLRVNVLGVEYLKKQVIKPADLSRIHSRDNEIYKGNKAERSYVLGYMELIVIKDIQRTKAIEVKSTKDNADKEIMFNTAFKLQETAKNPERMNNIVLVDKVYVYDNYRKCKIATWLISNLRDIVEEYTHINVGDILLIPGDFANEAGSKFDMNSKQYVMMLTKNYYSLGFKDFGNGLMINRIGKLSIKDNVVKIVNDLKGKLVRK